MKTINTILIIMATFINMSMFAQQIKTEKVAVATEEKISISTLQEATESAIKNHPALSAASSLQSHDSSLVRLTTHVRKRHGTHNSTRHSERGLVSRLI